MYEGSLPAVLLEEPYTVPGQYGQPPLGHDAQTAPDGGPIAGAGWTRDWRGQTFVGNAYQGFGGPYAYETAPGGQPTSWSPYTGLVPSQPTIPGYAGLLQNTSMGELRAGQTIGFPTSGQSEPGFDPVLLEIPFDQGVDVGWQQWAQQGRRMLFAEPPNISAQTQGIPAAGWP